MNAVEIEEAVSALAERPFDASEFPYLFLQAFGNKETTLKRLRKGESNKSDLGGVLQTNNIHIAVAAPGEVTQDARRAEGQPGDGEGQGQVHPGDGWRHVRGRGPRVAARRSPAPMPTFPTISASSCRWPASPPSSRVRENAFDIRATSRLNRLYVELLKDNPEWGTPSAATT